MSKTTYNNTMKKILKNSIVIIGLTFLMPGIISLLIKNSFKTYNLLNKPPLSPPSFAFPIVWSVIYLLISISIIRVKDNNDDNIKLYYKSLVLNVIWTPLFFLFKWHFIALLDLIILFISVIKMYKHFKKDDNLSSILLIPYLIWLIFAFYLNLYVVIFN